MLPAHATELGLPETAVPLQSQWTSVDTLNDLRAFLTENPDGYWLGAFCFRKAVNPVEKVSSAKSGKQKALPKLGDRLPEWVELKVLFADDDPKHRDLYLTHGQSMSKAKRRMQS